MRFWDRVLFGDARTWVCSQAEGRALEVAIDVDLTGIDLAPGILHRARGRALELGLAVDLQEADAHALPFADGSFDTVVCTFSLCNIPDERRAIAERHRVLKPGGLLLLADMWPDQPRPARRATCLREADHVPEYMPMAQE